MNRRQISAIELREEIEMYDRFADVYDRMMSETPYDIWFQRLTAYLERRGKTSGHLCELGCGTGEMAGRFADAGFEVTGIDLSPDMLALAAEKKKDGQDILYINQDMTDFSLHKPADVVLCICDSINYLLEEDELQGLFGCVRAVLPEDGIFVFDMKTEYCFEEILGNEIRVEDEEDYTVFWDNAYDPETKINEYMLTMFMREPGSGKYERWDECHRQRAYSPEKIREMLRGAGFELRDCFGEDMEAPPGAKDERIYFIAQPCNRN